MTYRGQVKNGVVVLEGNAALEEGTIVRVEPVRAADDNSRPGSAAAIMRHAGIWEGCREEVDRALAELKEMKRAEVRAQLEEWEREGNRNPLDEE
jgi:hypothetical protein